MSNEKTADDTANVSDGPSRLGEGTTGEGHFDTGTASYPYRVSADWLDLINEDREPTASMFYTSYTLGDSVDAQRPLTFLFNGGPGAASAFLHLGAAGPLRVRFEDDGTVPAGPVQLVPNAESWLPTTDLVCIDPVGAGFSRALPPKKGKDETVSAAPGAESRTKKAGEAFWEVGKDLESLAAFISRYLSLTGRWLSPIYLAGESYGGYRVARLAKILQGSRGIGLAGVVLLSPAIEFDGLMGNDYDLTHWVETFPAMAAAAHCHGRAGSGLPLESHLEAAEAFAEGDLLRLLVRGEALEEAERARIVESMANLIGLPTETIAAKGGRIGREAFCRALLADQQRYLGHHDASVTGVDPFPDRETHGGPDPVLDGQSPLFTMGINAYLRTTLGVKTDLEYDLLSMVAHKSWKHSEPHIFDMELAAMDDLRYGMALNPAMKVLLCYGYYDLVTPYYEARRLTRLMKLTDEQKTKLETRYFVGGHMFYARHESRAKLAEVIAQVCA